jgi:3-hydroxybutyryl-CoA dehydrogenase
MHIAVNANTEQKEICFSKGIPSTIQLNWFETGMAIPVADAYIDFDERNKVFSVVKNKPVFVNAVITTGSQLAANCIRMNAWNSFLERPVLEIAAAGARPDAAAILETLGWKYQWAPDVPGMVTARIVAMIINEAYFGLGDGISSKAEIDVAMKLGTNYPLGPFEWAQKIGLMRICQLLKELGKDDPRYAVAPALELEAG